LLKTLGKEVTGGGAADQFIKSGKAVKVNLSGNNLRREGGSGKKLFQRLICSRHCKKGAKKKPTAGFKSGKRATGSPFGHGHGMMRGGRLLEGESGGCPNLEQRGSKGEDDNDAIQKQGERDP